jgi:hypothetical protein
VVIGRRTCLFSDFSVVTDCTVLFVSCRPKIFLKVFINNFFTAWEAYKAIAALQREGGGEEASGPEVRDYSEYYRTDILEAGIRSGKLVAGILAVNKHLSAQEAFVSRGATSDVR